MRFAAVVLVLAATAPALATGGRVVDTEGNPVGSGKACLLVAGREGMCSDLDSQGRYTLPEASVPSLRIVSPGYLPKVIAAVDQESPIVLDRAASLRVRLRDAATGQPIPKGEVLLVTPSGQRAGPFPANAAGVRVATLPPGLVLPTGRAAGYEDGSGVAVDLVAGRESDVTLDLRPLTP
jgi:hypothetical protein